MPLRERLKRQGDCRTGSCFRIGHLDNACILSVIKGLPRLQYLSIDDSMRWMFLMFTTTYLFGPIRIQQVHMMTTEFLKDNTRSEAALVNLWLLAMVLSLVPSVSSLEDFASQV